MPPCGPVAPPPPPPPPPREPPPRRSGGAATASGQEAARACTSGARRVAAPAQRVAAALERGSSPPPREQQPSAPSLPSTSPEPQRPSGAARSAAAAQPANNARPSRVRASSASVLSVLPPRPAPAASAASARFAARRASASGGVVAAAWRRQRANALSRLVPLKRASAWRPSAASHNAEPRSSITRLSAATFVNMLHADRLRSADGAASDELTAELLERSVEEARVRQRVVMLRVLALAMPMCAGTLALFLITSAPTDAGRAGGAQQTDLAKPNAGSRSGVADVDVNVFQLARVLLLTMGLGGTPCLILLCLHASAQQRMRIIVACFFGLAIIVGGTVPFVETVARLAHGSTARGARDADALVTTLAAAVQVGVNAGAVARGLALLCRRWNDAHGLLGGCWSTLAIVYPGIAAKHMIAFVGSVARGDFSSDHEGGRVLAFFVFAPIPFNAFFTFFAASPWLRRRAQAMIALPGSGMQGVVASLAPLLGY
ncbi:hypothetical protein KFE25_014439, partial [Diacronema lutheri]